MNQKSYHNFFNNFANKTKLDIILLLKEKPLSVSEISKKINAEQSKVSHNLIKLNTCNIVDVKKIGKNRIYSLNEKIVIPILELVSKHRDKSKELCEECGKCY